MHVRISEILLVSAAITAGLLLAPRGVSGQATTMAEVTECQDCDICPGDPDRYAIYDDYQNDILNAGAPKCMTFECMSGLPCNEFSFADLDQILIRIASATTPKVMQLAAKHERIRYVEDRDALLVSGCTEGSIMAFIPISSGQTLLALGIVPQAQGAGTR